MHVLFLVWPALLLAASTPASMAGSRQPPAPHCIDAREIREAVQSDARTLAIRLNDDRRYRIELADACPGATVLGNPQLLSRGGWLCGSNEESSRPTDNSAPSPDWRPSMRASTPGTYWPGNRPTRPHRACSSAWK